MAEKPVIKSVVENYILDVKKVTRDGGSYMVRCPHCKRFMAIEGDDLSEIRGEQYTDNVCGGMLEVSRDAYYVKDLP